MEMAYLTATRATKFAAVVCVGLQASVFVTPEGSWALSALPPVTEADGLKLSALFPTKAATMPNVLSGCMRQFSRHLSKVPSMPSKSSTLSGKSMFLPRQSEPDEAGVSVEPFESSIQPSDLGKTILSNDIFRLHSDSENYLVYNSVNQAWFNISIKRSDDDDDVIEQLTKIISKVARILKLARLRQSDQSSTLTQCSEFIKAVSDLDAGVDNDSSCNASSAAPRGS